MATLKFGSYLLNQEYQPDMRTSEVGRMLRQTWSA
jgi:hypothetical protein